jgi:hypothetical protein
MYIAQMDVDGCHKRMSAVHLQLTADVALPAAAFIYYQLLEPLVLVVVTSSTLVIDDWSTRGLQGRLN